MRTAPVIQLHDRVIDPYKRSKLTTRDMYVLQIHGSYTAAVAAVIQVGFTLIEAKEQLPRGEFQAMVKNDLPFGVRTAQMFMAIARNKVLTNANHDSLPIDWNALYLATRLPENVLQAKIDSGEFAPDTRRRHVNRWLDEIRHVERYVKAPPGETFLIDWSGERPFDVNRNFSPDLLHSLASRSQSIGVREPELTDLSAGAARAQIDSTLRQLARQFTEAGHELAETEPARAVWSRAAERVLELAAELARGVEEPN